MKRIIQAAPTLLAVAGLAADAGAQTVVDGTAQGRYGPPIIIQQIGAGFGELPTTIEIILRFVGSCGQTMPAAKEGTSELPKAARQLEFSADLCGPRQELCPITGEVFPTSSLSPSEKSTCQLFRSIANSS
jgi:hypothetical protein